MKIKRYEAKDINAALKMIKAELGPEAIILSTKRINKGGGVLGGGGRATVEVVAAIDYEPVQPEFDKRPLQGGTERLSSRKEENGQIQELSRLRGEIAGLKKVVQGIVTRNGGNTQAAQTVEGLTAYLQSIGMESDLVCSLLAGATIAGETEAAESMAKLRTLITERLMEQLVLGEATRPENNYPRVWAFVGPTGVGKTTTAAKIAANFAVRQGKRVVLVSVDNYRIAASEQLRTYARILGVPFVAVVKHEELSQVITVNRDKDVILIDTAGRSQHDGEHMRELSRYIQAHPSVEAQLVLSATTQNGDMEDILAKYADLSVRGCIFSKIDESRYYGPIFNQAVRFRLPIYYLTTGQRVPEDIEVASRQRLAHLLWSGLGDN